MMSNAMNNAMNNEQVISVYESVSDLTGQMLAAAQSRDWENLAELESHCATQIQRLKDGEAPAALPAALRARKVKIIHQILAHDRQIRDLTTPWMAELAALIGNTGAERRLARAYGA
jgi:flagellar protein FliT